VAISLYYKELRNFLYGFRYLLKEIRHDIIGHTTKKIENRITEEYLNYALETMALLMDNININISAEIRKKKNPKTNDKERKFSEKYISELKMLQWEYWIYLNEYFIQKDMKLKLSEPDPKHYNYVFIGKTNFKILLTTSNNELSCGIRIGGKYSKKIFFELLKEKDNIEEELNTKNIEWYNPPGSEVTKIRIFYNEKKLVEKKEWDFISEWFRKNTELIYSVFYKRIKLLNI